MIELQRHIEILLLSNDCVIIPDLGGFMAHHMDARYDDEEQLFLPPYRTLGFNPQLKINDSLLVQSYIEAYDISYPEALRRIEGEVEELCQHIDNQGHYELTDIGTLYKNEDGHIAFTPCEAGILTPELYGLSSFDMPMTEASQSSAPLFDLPQKPRSVEVEEAVEETEETAQMDVDTDEEVTTIHVKMSWIRNAVAMAAAILAFFFITSPINDTHLSTLSMGQMQNGSFFSMPPKEKTSEKVPVIAKKDSLKKDSVVLTQNTELQKDTIKSQESVSTPKEQRNNYYVVLASQVRKKNAELYVEKLRRAGYAEAEVFIMNHVVRVVCGHYPSEDQAYRAVSKIRQKEEFSEAWVLKVKI